MYFSIKFGFFSAVKVKSEAHIGQCLGWQKVEGIYPSLRPPCVFADNQNPKVIVFCSCSSGSNSGAQPFSSIRGRFGWIGPNCSDTRAKEGAVESICGPESWVLLLLWARLQAKAYCVSFYSQRRWHNWISAAHPALALSRPLFAQNLIHFYYFLTWLFWRWTGLDSPTRVALFLGALLRVIFQAPSTLLWRGKKLSAPP